jgi:hypothetical protein
VTSVLPSGSSRAYLQSRGTVTGKGKNKATQKTRCHLSVAAMFTADEEPMKSPSWCKT